MNNLIERTFAAIEAGHMSPHSDDRSTEPLPLDRFNEALASALQEYNSQGTLS